MGSSIEKYFPPAAIGVEVPISPTQGKMLRNFSLPLFKAFAIKIGINYASDLEGMRKIPVPSGNS